MSNKKLRKAYQKELALELRGKKRKSKQNENEELLQLVADNAARNSR